MKKYNRIEAIKYAHEWAMKRNPYYFDFEKFGSDCTSFISQCLFAGSEIMNFNNPLGWYYIDGNDNAAAWTGTEVLYDFLTDNNASGPFGKELPFIYARPGDIIQLSVDGGIYDHSLIITDIGQYPVAEQILVASHSDDSCNRQLSTYGFKNARLIHIEGVNN